MGMVHQGCEAFGHMCVRTDPAATHDQLRQLIVIACQATVYKSSVGVLSLTIQACQLCFSMQRSPLDCATTSAAAETALNCVFGGGGGGIGPERLPHLQGVLGHSVLRT
jgi:hypothetical protein